MLDKPHLVSPFAPPRGPFILSTLSLEISLLSNSGEVVIDAGELAQQIQTTYIGHVFKIGQQFAASYQPASGGPAIAVKLAVLGFEYVNLDGSNAAGSGAGAQPEIGTTRFGMLQKTTEVSLAKNKNAPIKMTGSSSGKANKLFEKGFNFEG